MYYYSSKRLCNSICCLILLCISRILPEVQTKKRKNLLGIDCSYTSLWTICKKIIECVLSLSQDVLLTT